jgi:hypothetical protein
LMSNMYCNITRQNNTSWWKSHILKWCEHCNNT